MPVNWAIRERNRRGMNVSAGGRMGSDIMGTMCGFERTTSEKSV